MFTESMPHVSKNSKYELLAFHSIICQSLDKVDCGLELNWISIIVKESSFENHQFSLIFLKFSITTWSNNMFILRWEWFLVVQIKFLFVECNIPAILQWIWKHNSAIIYHEWNWFECSYSSVPSKHKKLALSFYYVLNHPMPLNKNSRE